MNKCMHRAFSNSGPPPLPLGLRFDALDRLSILGALQFNIFMFTLVKLCLAINILQTLVALEKKFISQRMGALHAVRWSKSFFGLLHSESKFFIQN